MGTSDIDFEKVLKHFQIAGRFVSCERYGCGHINDTYDVHFEEPKQRFILQRINDKIFHNVPALMNNIKLVTEYQRKVIAERGGDPDRESLTLIAAEDGKPYYRCEEGYFRVYKFIEGATSYQVVEKPEDFFSAGQAFGRFQNLLANFDASAIYEVIPAFHNTRKRFEDFKRAVKEDKAGRAAGVAAEIEFVMSREKYVDRIVDLLASGKMPLKVTHNDTKLNNVMIDDATGRGVCVIDLDTIMPGSSVYDFGDSIRFGTNPAAEDEKDLTKVEMDMGLFEEYAKGFLGEVRESLTPVEAENLGFASLLMTLECGMRFLADYLEGDVYFKVHREGHNLDRARTQFKLVSDMERNMPEMDRIVEKYYRG